MLPKVTIQGWQWKRFFPKYRRQKMIMQGLMNKKSVNIIDEMTRMMIDQMIHGSKLPFSNPLSESKLHKIYQPTPIMTKEERMD